MTLFCHFQLLSQKFKTCQHDPCETSCFGNFRCFFLIILCSVQFESNDFCHSAKKKLLLCEPASRILVKDDAPANWSISHLHIAWWKQVKGRPPEKKRLYMGIFPTWSDPPPTPGETPNSLRNIYSPDVRTGRPGTSLWDVRGRSSKRSGRVFFLLFQLIFVPLMNKYE